MATEEYISLEELGARAIDDVVQRADTEQRLATRHEYAQAIIAVITPHIEGRMGVKPTHTPLSIKGLVTCGYTRDQAFTLIRDHCNAVNGVVSIAYPSPESQSPQQMDEHERTALRTQIDLLSRVNTALQEQLKPYLSDEDVERVVMNVLEGK